MAMAGLVVYVVFAPHSVAASSIGVGLAGLGWLIRSIAGGSIGLRKSKFDLVILLSLLWTIASSVLSEEPRISLIKLRSSWCVFIFYLVRAVITRRTALMLVAILIVSGSFGSLYSALDLVRGRGVVVQAFTPDSPFRKLEIIPGDTIWRIGKTRVYSPADLNEALRAAPKQTPLTVSVISRGEHVERTGLVLGPNVSDAGIVGEARNHRFRASGFTSHYVTFAELLQMIALLALGLALAHLRNHGPNRYFRIALGATCVLAVGLTLTAMRTVIVAFAIGATVIAWRSLRGVAKLVFTVVLFLVLGFGAVVIWQTRANNALALRDPSSSLRAQVAKVGMSRILLHPVFGHGMDAMKEHWNEWGFPGKDMLHLHSTPLQLAFDRGLPMLLLWLWMMGAFWLHISRSVRNAADLSDTNSFGILLGILGALTGFLASSVVNYNYGDGEAAMLFWSLMGIALVLSTSNTTDNAPSSR
jgi:O-antigen ligase